jgi:uncharacterized membrane protein YdbT with pleckstrin-like domain
MNDEAFYEAVASEIQRKELKPGLWVKAVAESGGNNDEARSIYIKLRVNQLRDDDKVARARERATRAQEAQSEQRRRHEETLIDRQTGLLQVCYVVLGLFLALFAFGFLVVGFPLFSGSRSQIPTALLMIALSVLTAWGSVMCFKKARLPYV